jgi:uncharacterized protein (TIGR00255 family)
MTGFGRGVAESTDWKYTIEIKSVNHRFTDFTFKMPSYLGAIEGELRSLLKEKISRGKIDISITIKNISPSPDTGLLDETQSEAMLLIAKRISDKFGIQNDITASKLLAMPGVLTNDHSDFDLEKEFPFIKKAFNEALDKLISARESEGERLKNDLLSKITEVEELDRELRERAPQIVKEYSERLRNKVSLLLDDANIDENRIAEEVIIYSDRICIDEEMTRLESHISEFRKTLENGGETGRRLDFITQELNRESNTILSKSSDVLSSDIGIELKTLIEKIREQVQNLE